MPSRSQRTDLGGDMQGSPTKKSRRDVVGPKQEASRAPIKPDVTAKVPQQIELEPTLQLSQEQPAPETAATTLEKEEPLEQPMEL